ncbi:MAG: Ig-like domain-containing protein, partial [Bacteroidota bacterium]
DSDNIFDSGGRMHDMRQNVLPILENYGVDLVLSGHSHSYERSFLLEGHFGNSNTLTNAMILDGGDGRSNGDGSYVKNFANTLSSAGTVYITAGNAGKLSGGSLNHPVMFASFNTLGSCVMEVDSNLLELKFLNNSGGISDSFSIVKNFVIGQPPAVSMTYPGAGDFILIPSTISLTANASDPDGNIQSVEYFIDGLSVGQSNSAPFSLDWTIPASGAYDVYAIATDNDGNTSTSATHSFTVGSSTGSVTVAVSAGNDDAEEETNGAVNLTSTDLELINENSGTDQLVGIRFQNIGVPAGAKIDSAFLQFTVDETNNQNPSILRIRAEAHFDAPAFTSADGNLSNRRFTKAHRNWSPPNWNTVGQANNAQRTPNLAPVLQEVVDLPGWQSGNAAALFVYGWGRRVAESVNGTAAPELFVYYSIQSPPANTAPAVKIRGLAEGSTRTNYNPIRFEALTSDSTGYVAEVEFYLDGILQTTDSSFPFSFTFTPSANASIQLIAVARDQGGLTKNDTLNFVIDNSLSLTSQTFQISDDDDDSEERQNGTINLNDNRLELIRDNSAARGRQVVGLRFQNLSIPQGAQIYEAYLQFTSASGTENYHIADLRISAEAADNAAAFTNANQNLSSRARTQASQSWSPPLWLSANQAAAPQQSPDLSLLLQEVVDRPGWQSNNALVILLDGEGGRPAYAHDANPNLAAQLIISYQALIPPSISISAPLDGTIFPAPQAITFEANATDADGTVDSVEYYLDGVKVGAAYASPWQYSHSVPSSGTYTLTAIATDDDGNSTTSAAIQFT